MPLVLQPLTAADTLSWTRIRTLAYLHLGPTHDLLHSNQPISESSIRGVAENNARDFQNPNFWPWKVVDTELAPSEDDPEGNGGRTIAIALYELEKKGKGGEAEKGKEEEKRFMPPELRLDALTALITPLREAEKEIMGNTDRYLMLNVLATHPEHQRRGAAKMLLDVGLKRADEEGLVMYLSSSWMGRPIYEKAGFELVKECDFDRGEWGGEGVERHGCMVRQPKKV
ncbi:hypothetical protein DM02DRAFT_611975 [Periconia macrospinosa]|uniref:N-acetyltransferase domain-containing protein n=1 Tax=Periconia macrospinosa TaxID=97972 RepID=A0A2V1E3S8_9PLEO|nr:hypothetical protein DM02DRAFT_611975 [Periconia macrospinosa]